ncbi:Syntaxin-10 [Coemansia interrupta]|uniref:Syntaxin-10 n=1 Tax=Coemansia interrupta TaxID=1126814 RepID=A0A9W8LMU0_9FUNG|nr:Syntaxin-10 [Coemansia interrupta]
MSDPFLIVQDEVVSSFDQARMLLASWKKLDAKRRSPQEENEYQYMTDELHSSLKAISTDLTDLQETIDVARDFPEDYGLNAAKLNERQQFVTTRFKAIDEMRRVLSVQPAASKKPSAAANTAALNESRAQSESIALEFTNNQGQQQMLMQQQDEHLDEMLGTVRNLHGIAGTMNTELDSQAILLDEVSDMVDRTQSNIQSAQRKVQKFLSDKGNRSLHIIIILFIVILVLLLLVIFT